jgi:tetratricopeptide (TPR) repeat protein
MIPSSARALTLALVVMTANGRAWGQAVFTPTPAATRAGARQHQESAPLERASTVIQRREFEQAAVILRELLSVDPDNRNAKELLAFALESMRDLAGERQVRSALAAEYPDDARIQADYGRVLERSGDEAGALRAYRRARELRAGTSAPELDAAIARMRGRTALEVGTPLAVMSDPEAAASCVQAGAAVPFGSRHHLALLGTHAVAEGKRSAHATTASDVLALSVVLQDVAGTSWTVGPRLHVVSPRGSAHPDLGVGGVIAGRAPFGSSLEAEWRAEVETPWDEAPLAVLRGGRTTAAEGHLYTHGFARRLLLQAGARARQLSILAADPRSTARPEAWQSLWVAGADFVLWRKPGDAVRGEMLDEALIAPVRLSPAVTLAYRHYEVATRTTPEFAAQIGLLPRGSVDEASVATTVTSARGHVGLELHAGLGRDAARQARMWRAGGALILAPKSATRFALGYEGSTEVVTGLVGQRRAGWLSFHVDL